MLVARASGKSVANTLMISAKTRAVGPVPVQKQTRLAADQLALTTQRGSGSIPAAVSFEQLEQLAASVPKDWGQVTVSERQNNLQKLQNLAHRLRDQNVPGVDIWSDLMQASLEQYANRGLSPERQADFAMQDLTLTVVGPDAVKHLNDYQDLFWNRNPDTLVQQFFDDWAQLGITPDNKDWEQSIGWAGSGLDRHVGKDFRPEINDGTNNQIYHTMFYEFMGYVTQDNFNIRAGSMVHELRDGGTSSEDHNAQYVGVATGKALRALRDGPNTASALKDFAAMTRAAYSKKGGAEILAGTASPRAWAMHAQICDKLEHKSLIWKSENTVIDGLKWLKNKFSD